MTRYPVVYRLYDLEGRLLYIGSSGTLMTRLSCIHQQIGFALRDVVRVDVEHFDTIAEARAAEGKAILAEQPIHNVVGKGSLSVPRHTTDAAHWPEEGAA